MEKIRDDLIIEHGESTEDCGVHTFIHSAYTDNPCFNRSNSSTQQFPLLSSIFTTAIADVQSHRSVYKESSTTDERNILIPTIKDEHLTSDEYDKIIDNTSDPSKVSRI